MSVPEKTSAAPGEENRQEKGEATRRDFFTEIAAAALGIAGLGATVVTVKYLSPNVLFEPPTSFRAGRPEDYPADSVTFMENHQVYIVRTTQGFYAVSAVCTHLGCITKWNPEAGLIQCPCHGSQFKADGTKLAGPAPKSLPHFNIELTASGELQVDKLEIIKDSQVLKV